jgi:hypothetical protein
MIILLLILFAVGLLGFWTATDRDAEQVLDERPHLHVWSRFYPR